MKLHHLPALRRHFGTAWLARRALYSLKLRSGAVRRRNPARTWDDAPTPQVPGKGTPFEAETFSAYRRAHPRPFFFSAADRLTYAPLLQGWDNEANNPMREADALAHGKFRFFEHHELQCGYPPNWHANALSTGAAPASDHWSEIGDFGYGDIKAIWEPSRFGFAYALVRAYWRTADETYPETFWRLVEDWRVSNPPQRGANWKCGQEATFRAMAWCFALYGFSDSAATTPDRAFALTRMLGATAERIAANIDYAIGQANNHGISEGVGLWTIGTLFPEFPAADAWRRRGRAVLEAEGRKLIYDDGAFSQHSVNYHRLMLHDYLWALRLGELHQVPFTDELKQRVTQAGEFLFQIQDEFTGRVPYYGQNDGALILPLNNCGYHDFRPVVSATHYLADRTRLFDDGPWSEDLLWLFGRDSLGARMNSKPRADLRAHAGGYYTLRSREGFVFTRCAKFRHRPGQADMLHVDLWWRGQNIATDAGTFSYNSAEPWADAFAGTGVHNTVAVDGADQMERVGKFLWLPWVEARRRHVIREGSLAYFEGEHDGYMRLASGATHRRAIVQLTDETWLVLDALGGAEQHRYSMQWLLPDYPHRFDPDSGLLVTDTSAGPYYVRAGAMGGSATCSLVRADAETARGWRAPFYSYREPALSLRADQTASSAIFWTAFSPMDCDVEIEDNQIRIANGAATATIALGIGRSEPLVTRIEAPANQLRVK